MSDIDKDLQHRLQRFAEGISSEPQRSALVVRSARRKRRLVALSAGLAVVLTVGGLAGATTLLGNPDGIRPAPGPEETAACEQPEFDIGVLVAQDATAADIVILGEQLEADPRVETLEFVPGNPVTPPPGRRGPIRPYSESDRYEVTLAPGVRARTEMFQGLAHSARTYVPDRECPPSGPRQQFARYVFDVTEGNASAIGTLDVDAAAAKLCLTLARNNITASHLLFMNPDRPDDQGRIVFTFLDRSDADEGLNLPMSRQCFRGEELGDLSDQLQLLVDQPERFAIDFHRGPNDEPGLVAELVPVGGEEELADPLKDSIQAQGGTIRMQVIPGSAGRGRIAEVALVNATDSQIFYGHAYELERQGPRGWRHVRSPDTCVFTQELLSVAPGEKARHPIGPYSDQCDVLPLRHGTYRVTKDVELASGERLELEVTFSITPAVKNMQILQRQLTAARRENAVRKLVWTFMKRRVAGGEAEEFLDPDGHREFGPGGNLAPLYPDPPLQDFQIEFIDDLGDGSYEVGVSLVFQQGSYGETLFVRERNGELVISGGRPGLEGP